MISRSEMVPLLVDACPSFAEKWEEHKVDYFDVENFLSYVALGEFARHLIDLWSSGNISEFEDVFAVVERFHIDGEHYVREAATIGLLEGIQNIAENDTELFYPYLQPQSAKWWVELKKFLNGEIKYVSETFTEDV